MESVKFAENFAKARGERCNLSIFHPNVTGRHCQTILLTGSSDRVAVVCGEAIGAEYQEYQKHERRMANPRMPYR